MKATINEVAKHIAYEYGLNYKDVLYVLERLEEKNE